MPPGAQLVYMRPVEPIRTFFRRSWFAVAALAVAGTLLISAAWSERGLSRVVQLRAELARTEDRNFRLVQQIATLRRDIEMARSDDATLERLARRYLGMVRPGEVIYRVPPPEEAHRGPAAAWPATMSDDPFIPDEDEEAIAPAAQTD